MTQENPTLPPIFFNHLYVVLDDKTYRAVQGSDFLRIAFPGLERRSTLTAAGETWYGTYFYARDNYLEFFGSGTGPVSGASARSGHWQAGAQEGWAGLAFSTDRPGGAYAVRDAVREALGYEPYSELRQLRVDDHSIDWFYNVKLAERLSLGSFDSWVMEYHPDIFHHKGIPTPASGELSRQAYLSPWNKERVRPKSIPMEGSAGASSRSGVKGLNTAEESGVNQSLIGTDLTAGPLQSDAKAVPGEAVPGTSNQPVFSGITGATLHMDFHRAERYAEILRLLGFQQAQSGDGLALSANGFTLTIRPEETAPGGYRLSAVRLAMTRPSVSPMTFVFAPRSRLILNDDLTADWFFGI